jgi:hypothetical protein
MPTAPATFWKRKLAAFLHDPPSKQFDIANHDQARGVILRHMGLSDEDMRQWWKSPGEFYFQVRKYVWPRSLSKLGGQPPTPPEFLAFLR